MSSPATAAHRASSGVRYHTSAQAARKITNLRTEYTMTARAVEERVSGIALPYVSLRATCMLTAVP
jgi:hypothetical protein